MGLTLVTAAPVLFYFHGKSEAGPSKAYAGLAKQPMYGKKHKKDKEQPPEEE